ncbi:nuclear transport factor 2 family protein [Sphingobium estronivorans]|uniref:nuclear transport factor 2 family protein n=1 Tax=Sphingobium estronivorans TaxID=1577690 RepID=UPI001239F3C0|nr:nuclear transport factor 2 family protein [Sphingobium estronivorans]
MSVTLESLAARIAALEDINAIRQLKARYLRACDLKQVEDLRDTLAPQGLKLDYQNFPLFTDREAFIALFESMACQGGVYDLHHAGNADIELTGPDEARGRWTLNFRTIILGLRSVTQLVVEYEDVYRRQDGRWWIAESVSRISSMLTEEIAEDGASRYLVWGEAPPPPAQAAE